MLTVILMIRMLSSCCTEPDISASKGFCFRFTDSSMVEKIELVGVGKTIVYNSRDANITLNPADSSSKYKVFRKGGRSGTIELIYTSELVYLDNYCHTANTIDILHKPRIANSTFSKTEIKTEVTDSKVSKVYVEITP
jgi:hypothetical protein